MIQCPHWHAQLIVWLTGAYGVLTGDVKQPADLKKNAAPSVEWNVSYSLDGDYTGDYDREPEIGHFLPEANRIQALATIRSTISEEMVYNWQLSISAYDYFESELGNIPEHFCDLYLKST